MNYQIIEQKLLFLLERFNQ